MSEHRPSFLWLPLALLSAVVLGFAALRYQRNNAPEAAARGPVLATGPRAMERAPAGGDLPSDGSRKPRSSPGQAVAVADGQVGKSPKSLRPLEGPRASRIDSELSARFEGLVSSALAEVERQGKAKRSECAVAYRVVDLESGLVIAERGPDVGLESASNMKLITTLGALLMLGPDWNFETAVDALGTLEQGRLKGDLVVRSSGDPFYVHDSASGSQARVADLAQAIAESGLSRVEGDLVIDRGGFMEPAPAPGWPSPNLFWTKSYALAAGISVQAGLLTATIEPASAGAPARVTLTPWPSGLRETFAVSTVAERINDVRIGLYDSTRRLDVLGRYGAGLPPYETQFRHPEPEAQFAAVLRHELERFGVAISGDFRIARALPVGRRLALHRQPWIENLAAINQDSANSVADGLLLTLGMVRSGEGTREAGARAVADTLEAHGLPITGLGQVDGSGLSRDNRITVRVLSEALCAIQELPSAPRQLLIDSLAVAGESGTLDDRMLAGPARGRVRAKTGWIVGASALSGYAQALDGHSLCFSILVGYPRLSELNTRAWKPMQDRMCEALVEWDGGR